MIWKIFNEIDCGWDQQNIFRAFFVKSEKPIYRLRLFFLDHGFLKGLFSVPYWGCKQSKYIWLCVFVIVYILERDRLGNIPYVISRIYFIGCYNTTQFNTSRYFELCEKLEHYEMAWLKKLFLRLNIYILLFVFQCLFPRENYWYFTMLL